MAKNEIHGISWALFLLGAALGFELGAASAQIFAVWGVPALEVVIPLVAMVTVYRKVIPRHDDGKLDGEVEKDKNK